MAQKPLTEALTLIFVREVYRLDPNNTTPWENMSTHAQELYLAGMAEVVRTFKGFGLELANEGGKIVLRSMPKKAGAQVAKKSDLDPMEVSNPRTSPSSRPSRPASKVTHAATAAP